MKSLYVHAATRGVSLHTRRNNTYSIKRGTPALGALALHIICEIKVRIELC